VSELVINPYALVPAGPFDPLTSIPWVSAYWASDPAWTPPADGGAVTDWPDAGTANADLAQATAAVQPTYRAAVAALNNKPAVEFAADDHLDVTGIATIPQPFAVVAVLDVATTAGSQLIVNDAAGASDSLLGISAGAFVMRADASVGTGTPTVGGQLVVAKYAGAASNLTKDGVTGADVNPGTVDHENARYLGTSLGVSGFAGGRLAFVGVLDRDLSAGERSNMRTWSQSFYGTA
jgi:hypothetical protein